MAAGGGINDMARVYSPHGACFLNLAAEYTSWLKKRLSEGLKSIDKIPNSRM